MTQPSFSRHELAKATQEFIYIMNELSPDKEISDLFPTEEVDSWLRDVVIPTHNLHDIHEFCRAAILSRKSNNFIANTFIKSCNALSKQKDLKVLSKLYLPT